MTIIIIDCILTSQLNSFVNELYDTDKDTT